MPPRRVSARRLRQVPTPPPDDPGPGEGIQGSLTVHSNLWELVTEPDNIQGIYVLLGDGSQFRTSLSREGVAHLEDPAIVGPQDVTLLIVVKDDPEVALYTYLALDKAEIWIPPVLEFTRDPERSRQATIKGRITGSKGERLSVSAVGPGFTGFNYAGVAPDGTFSLDVSGEAPGVVRLFVKEDSGSPSYLERRVGLSPEIPVSGGQTISGVEVALDHEVDQTHRVNVNGWQDYAGEPTVTLSYYLGSEQLFSTEATGVPPLNVPAIARTAPFDAVRMKVSTRSGAYNVLPAGNGVAGTPVTDPSATTSTLLAPLRVLSPPLGTNSAPAVAPRAGFVLRWSVDPSATQATVRLADLEGGAEIDWTVTAPASITSFTPFTLQAELTTTTVRASSYMVDARSQYRAGQYMDGFTQAAASGDTTTPTETRSTVVSGYVDLQD